MAGHFAEMRNVLFFTFCWQNFRQSPSIDTNIISTLNENSQITVLAKDGSWYKVEVNGQVGYVDGYYLQVNPINSNNNSNSSQSNNPNSNVQGIGTGSLINTTFLHLRDGASTNTNIIETDRKSVV